MIYPHWITPPCRSQDMTPDSPQKTDMIPDLCPGIECINSPESAFQIYKDPLAPPAAT